METPWEPLTELGRRREREQARLRRLEPRTAGELVSNVLQRQGHANQRQAELLQRAWRKVVEEVEGAGVAAGRSRPGRIRRGVLEIWVLHAAIHQELGFCKAGIVERLQREAADMGIRDIRIRVSPRLDLHDQNGTGGSTGRE